MNEILSNILTRRSCRKFLSEEIKAEDLECILKAGVHAPSAMNRQSWQFTVVKNNEMIKRLEGIVKNALGRERYNMYGANTLVMLSNDRDNDNGMADCACAIQNIFLMANSLNIGSCWINQFKTICDETQVRAILDELGIPKNHIIWGVAALGYANREMTAPLRNENVIKYIV